MDRMVVATYAKELIPRLSLIASVYGMMYHLSTKISITRCVKMLLWVDLLTTPIALFLNPVHLIVYSEIVSGIFILLIYKVDLYLKRELPDSLDLFPKLRTLSGIVGVIVASISTMLVKYEVDIVMLLKMCMVLSLPNTFVIYKTVMALEKRKTNHE
jgi:hypothetical protein